MKDNEKEISFHKQDAVSKKILEYILEKKRAPFNEIEKELSSQKVATRNTIFGRLVRLEMCGILLPGMKRMPDYGKSHIHHWIKEYQIAEKQVPWVGEMLKTEVSK